MVLDESLSLGVVLIGVNNPHLDSSEVEEYKSLCPRIEGHPLLNSVYNPDDIQKERELQIESGTLSTSRA